MNNELRTFGLVSAILAFLICLTGGVIILAKIGKDSFPTGIAVYFIGKAIFVGAMLIITTKKA